jgi:hypothetical protein
LITSALKLCADSIPSQLCNSFFTVVARCPPAAEGLLAITNDYGPISPTTTQTAPGAISYGGQSKATRPFCEKPHVFPKGKHAVTHKFALQLAYDSLCRKRTSLFSAKCDFSDAQQPGSQGGLAANQYELPLGWCQPAPVGR